MAVAGPTRHLLPAEHVHHQWDDSLPPVLTIDSGDQVVVDCRVLTEEQVLPGAGPSAITQIDWKRIHALTGPIFVRGAEPGDTLEIVVNQLRTSSWGVSWIDPTYGLLMDDFKEPSIWFFDLTSPDGTVELAGGLRVQLAPFLGVMGVAPKGGPYPTPPPGDFGGNLDIKELTAGSRLFLPVQVSGALFSCGDGHAVQGDGEVCSAIECGMTAHLEFILHKDEHITAPRVETADAIMTVGHADTLEEAARRACRDMVQYLQRTRGLSAADAYLLCSLAGDARINEVVNGNPLIMGARYRLPKSVFGGIVG